MRVKIAGSRNAQRPDQYAPHQVKRQATATANGRPSVNSASFRSQTPLQQPYRPAQQPGFRAGAQQPGAQGAAQSGQQTGFAPAAQADQLFVPLRDAGEAPVRARQGPSRPAPLPTASRNPEYAAGFPEGFTAGLPAFDFQGRMPGTKLFITLLTLVSYFSFGNFLQSLMPRARASWRAL